MLKIAVLSCLVCLVAATPAAAQPAATAPCVPSLATLTWSAASQESEPETGHSHLVGAAEIQPACSSLKFSADDIHVYAKENRIVASGNVVFVNPDGRIAAESIEFDLTTGLGTFHQATGVMSLGPKADRKQFGNQEPDVFFYGESIEKLGPQKYHITNGGFTTCTQPTPRWAVGSANLDLNLNDYAIARNMVLRVKGVPLLYLPIVYYPIQNDDRATGFLLPTYGTSTLRGQAVSNAFFWAIGRSQDATFFHDWFTRSGQGGGVEYRYVTSPLSNGTVRYYLLDQHKHDYTTDGVTTTLGATRSYEVVGNMTQVLTPHLRARARVDYVSNLLTEQLYNQNVARTSNPIRTIDGNLSGVWRAVTSSASFQRTETFSSPTQSFVYGGTPRVTATVAPRQIFGLPIYTGLTSEYAHLPYQQISDGKVLLDNSLTRVDLNPTVRVPLSTLTFLTVNSSAAYRTTYYSRSVDTTGALADQPLTRRYLTLRSSVIGPVLTKIWDTPASARSQRMKHVIEPTFTVDYFTDITNYQATPILTDATDKVVGGMAQYTYGLNNRLFYRSRPTADSRSITREFFTVGVQQTYYTKPEASLSDSQYTSGRLKATRVSPVALTARFSPSAAIDANSRVEYDTSGLGLRQVSFGSTLSANGSSSNLTLSHTPEKAATATTAAVTASTYMSGSTSLAFRQNRFRSLYAISWDIARGYIVSQRLSQSYLAQCCGFEVEFQNFNYRGSGIPIPADRRMNFSFILAGLGTFSNFFGAFGGQR
jgi:LPS-assembly protein